MPRAGRAPEERGVGNDERGSGLAEDADMLTIRERWGWATADGSLDPPCLADTTPEILGAFARTAADRARAILMDAIPARGPDAGRLTLRTLPAAAMRRLGAAAARAATAPAVLVSATDRPARQRLTDHIGALRTHLPAGTRVAVGGPGLGSSHVVLHGRGDAVLPPNDPVAALRACGIDLNVRAPTRHEEP